MAAGTGPGHRPSKPGCIGSSLSGSPCTPLGRFSRQCLENAQGNRIPIGGSCGKDGSRICHDLPAFMAPLVPSGEERTARRNRARAVDGDVGVPALRCQGPVPGQRGRTMQRQRWRGLKGVQSLSLPCTGRTAPSIEIPPSRVFATWRAMQAASSLESSSTSRLRPYCLRAAWSCASCRLPLYFSSMTATRPPHTVARS